MPEIDISNKGLERRARRMALMTGDPVATDLRWPDVLVQLMAVRTASAARERLACVEILNKELLSSHCACGDCQAIRETVEMILARSKAEERP